MIDKDWTGNKRSTFVTLGASSHSDGEREPNDYYATEPKAIKLLLEEENFWNVWECACGEGHLAIPLEEIGILGKASDLIDRGYGETEDFLKFEQTWNGCIITNPPYKYSTEFVEKALNSVEDGQKVAMFLRIQFLEGKARQKLFDKFPPKKVYVASGRLKCCINGDFSGTGASATAYAWFVWEKGYYGDTVIKWIN